MPPEQARPVKTVRSNSVGRICKFSVISAATAFAAVLVLFLALISLALLALDVSASETMPTDPSPDPALFPAYVRDLCSL